MHHATAPRRDFMVIPWSIELRGSKTIETCRGDRQLRTCTHLPEYDFLSAEKAMRKPDSTLHIFSTLLSDNRPASESERSFLANLGYLRTEKASYGTYNRSREPVQVALHT